MVDSMGSSSGSVAVTVQAWAVEASGGFSGGELNEGDLWWAVENGRKLTGGRRGLRRWLV